MPFFIFLSIIGGLIHIYKIPKGYFGPLKFSAFLIPVIIMFVLGLTQLVAIHIVQLQALKKVKNHLEQPDLKIKVSGIELDSSLRLTVLSELKSIKRIRAHNSHPVNNIIINLYSKNDSIKLEIGKDVDVKNEYWVFWDKYFSTTDLDLGRIKAISFEKIQ